MKPLRYDQPVMGEALLLGARLPREDEVPKQPLAPREVAPGVLQAADGKMFTALEEPKGASPERLRAKKAAFKALYGGRPSVDDAVCADFVKLEERLASLVAAKFAEPIAKVAREDFEKGYFTFPPGWKFGPFSIDGNFLKCVPHSMFGDD